MKLFDKLIGLVAYGILKYFSKKYRGKYPKMALLADDTLSRKVLVYGRYEKEFLEKLEKEFLAKMPTGKIGLDLGANLGNHSLAIAKYFDHVHAFEPNKRTCQLLSYNAALADNITAHNIGASNQNGVLKAMQTAGNQAANRIVQEINTDTEYLEYDCRVLDDYLGAEITGNIGFVKIDVEGHELQVLQGMVNIIKQSSPLIAFELLKGSIHAGSSPVIDFLKTQGYQEFFELYKVSPVRVGVRKIDSIRTKNYKMLLARKKF